MPGEAHPAFAVKHLPGRAVVELRGVLDEAAAESLRQAVADLRGANAKLVVLDMRLVPLVDSEALGMLINAQKGLIETGRRLVLVGCQEPVRIALSVTRLEVLFPHYPSLESIPER